MINSQNSAHISSHTAQIVKPYDPDTMSIPNPESQSSALNPFAVGLAIAVVVIVSAIFIIRKRYHR